ncbi:MAG: sulfotransferase [Calditrichae bacterium]|nr:sulfotransferase [Calditrichota bacterium]MCB9059589.1 sulfotransferase [Calditrichia bacterium]
MNVLTPVFIIGNPRSGTTLLRLMLTSHPEIMIPPECGFAMWFYDKYKKHDFSNDSEIKLSAFLDDLVTAKKIEHWRIDRNKLFRFLGECKPQTYAEVVAYVYIFYGKSISKEFSIWGDKNNFYLKYVDQIKELFPGAYFIHIVRDGRDIACSYRKIMKQKIDSDYAPKFPDNIKDIADDWTNNLKAIYDSFKRINFDNVLELRYEDLVLNPEETLKKVCELIGMQYHPGMLNYHELSEEKGGEPREFMQWKADNKKPVQTTSGKNYLLQLSQDEIIRFNKIAKDILSRYGYEH